MKILFFLRHQGYLRNFDSTVRLLAERGHTVHLALSWRAEGLSGQPTAASLAELEAQYPQITSGIAPEPTGSRWERYNLALRASLDWLRYLAPAFRQAEKLRARAQRHASMGMRRFMRLPGARSPLVLGAVMAVLRVFERAAPVREVDCEFIAAHEPDLVLVTPLLDGGIQHGYLRAAHRLGIPAGLCMSSWDNFTSKGLIYGEPDFVTVWNESLKREAVQYHDLDAERIVPTGAQAYDHWFDWQPSTTREEFCADLGLDPQSPFLLYMCSSGFISGDHESGYITRWIEGLRAQPGLERIAVLVRPHPVAVDEWRNVTLDFAGVAVWRTYNTEPALLETKREFFDSIYHSAGVVGLNTSALVESAIIGRPVFTLLSEEFEQTQTGTLHFGLIAGEEGMLDVASSIEEHAGHVAAALADPAYGAERRRRFLEAFVRPFGLENRSTDRLAATLEAQGERAREPRREPLGRRILRLLLTPATYRRRRSKLQLEAESRKRQKQREKQTAIRRKQRQRFRQRHERRLSRRRKRLRKTTRRATRWVPRRNPVVPLPDEAVAPLNHLDD